MLCRDEVMHVFEQHGTTYQRLCRGLDIGDKLRQSGEYLAGGMLDAFVNSPAMLSIATQLLGGKSSLYMPFSAVKNGGGGGRFTFTRTTSTRASRTGCSASTCGRR
jgi:2-oxoglutarate-dependent dioxygenase